MAAKAEFKPTTDMIHAARAVFTAMAGVDTIKPIVRGYQRAILAAHQFHIARKWIGGRSGEIDRVILDPEETYLMEADDFKVYLEESNKARIAAHLHVDKPEFCPLLVAAELLRKAQRVLVESMEPITHLTPDSVLCGKDGLENYEKLIDLTLRLLAPFVSK